MNTETTMMKRTLALLATLTAGLVLTAHAFPTATLTTTIDGTVEPSAGWDDFEWQMNGNTDYSITWTVTGLGSLTGENAEFKMSKVVGAEKVVYLTKTTAQMTVSGSNITCTVSHTNVPPDDSYMAELMLSNTGATSYRSLGRGTIRTVDSLFDDDDGTYTFPDDVVASDYLTVVGAASTYVPLTRTITINGVTGILSGNLTFTTDGDITAVTITAGTGMTGTVATTSGQHTQTLALNAASIASLARADAALTNAAVFATAAQGTKADTAHGWGDHATNGYLKTYAETDPNWAAESNAVTTHVASTANPHAVTLQQAVTAGGGTAVTNVPSLTMNSILQWVTSNTRIGRDVLSNLSSGDNNVMIGRDSGRALISGANNVAVGNRTIYASTNTQGNVAVGESVLSNLRSGFHNTGVGDNVLVMLNTGAGNAAFGQTAMYYNVGGWWNTAIGEDAMQNATNGNRNVVLGAESALSLTNGSGNIIIGSEVDVPTGTTSDYLNIGNLLRGNLANGWLGIGVTNPLSVLHVVGGPVRIGAEGTINAATGTGDLYVQDALEVDGESTLKQVSATYFICAGDPAQLKLQDMGLTTPKTFYLRSGAGAFRVLNHSAREIFRLDNERGLYLSANTTNMAAAVDGSAGIFAAQDMANTNNVELFGIDDQANYSPLTPTIGGVKIAKVFSLNRHVPTAKWVTRENEEQFMRDLCAKVGLRADDYITTTANPFYTPWENDEADRKAAADAAIAAWQSDTNAPSAKGDKPAAYIVRPKPEWLVDALKPREVVR
jgi:hypothetical protein